VKQHAHLLEERLFDCYLAERSGEALAPPLADHLADCPACAERYADLASFMDALGAEAVAEADAVFTPDRLRAQQQQIVRRLELAAHPARVITFPRPFARRTMTPSHSHAAPRWTAAAAAAGLFVGVAVGASYNFGAHVRSTSQAVARQSSAPAALGPVATRGAAPATVAADDAFLSDLEIALERPHTRELLAFDALTPHVREVKFPR
jgi:anti-sigma factor RsiW